MTTDVINGVPRELLEQLTIELEHDTDRYMLGRELRKLLATAQHAADGERDNHPVFDFLLGAGPLCGAWFGETPEGAKPYWWREHLRKAIAAQPQQAVVVTDVSTLKTALAELHKCGVKPGSLPHMVLTNLIDAAHKTGEEE